MECKPGKELLRLFALEDEKEKKATVMVASPLPKEKIAELLKRVLEQIEKGEGDWKKIIVPADTKLSDIQMQAEQ